MSTKTYAAKAAAEHVVPTKPAGRGSWLGRLARRQAQRRASGQTRPAGVHNFPMFGAAARAALNSRRNSVGGAVAASKYDKAPWAFSYK